MVPEKVHTHTGRHQPKGPNHKPAKKVPINTQGREGMVHGPTPKSLSPQAFSEGALYYQEAAPETLLSKNLPRAVASRDDG